MSSTIAQADAAPMSSSMSRAAGSSKISSSSRSTNAPRQGHHSAQPLPTASRPRSKGTSKRTSGSAAAAESQASALHQQQQHQQQQLYHHQQQQQHEQQAQHGTHSLPANIYQPPYHPGTAPGIVAYGHAGAVTGGAAPQPAAAASMGAVAGPSVGLSGGLPPPQFGSSAHESKKDKKRKEVVDRIYRVHWDTFDERETMYQEQYQSLSDTYSALLNTPLQHRPYLLALANLALERDQQLRESALFSLHQIESVRNAHAVERSKIEDEARLQKKHVRETLLGAMEERRKRLREEKEGGNEFAVELSLDNAMRNGAIRKLRNKGGLGGSRSSRHAALDDDDGADGDGGAANGGSGSGSGGGGAGTGAGGAHNGDRSGLGGSSFLGGADGLSARSTIAAGAGGLSTAAILAASASAAAAAGSSGRGDSGGAGGGSGSGSGAGSGSGSGQARAIQVNLPLGLQFSMGLHGGLEMVSTSSARAAKYEIGKSLSGLTSAKDFEIEADMFSIRKTGGKRRRR